MKQIGLMFAFITFFNLTHASDLPPSLEGVDLKIPFTNIDLSKSTNGTVVIFLSSHCPCSNSYTGLLKELAQSYSTKGIQFVGINSNIDESTSDIEIYFSKLNLPFPVLRDDNNKWANQFGALKTPHVFIVNKENKIIYNGGIGEERKLSNEKNSKSTIYLKEVLEDITHGKAPRYNETRTLGCVIKR